MTYKCIHLIVLMLLLIGQLFSQQQYGAVKGIVSGSEINLESLKKMNIFIEALDGEKWKPTKYYKNDAFEISAPAGIYLLKVQDEMYYDFVREIKIHPDVVNEIEFPLFYHPSYLFLPWSYSEPIPKLTGNWKTIMYIDGTDTIDHSQNPNSTELNFHFSDDGQPGQLSWTKQGYLCTSLFFRCFKGNYIELYNKGHLFCGQVSDFNRNLKMDKFIENMRGKPSKISFLENDQILEISLENEKFLFLRKSVDRSWYILMLRGVYQPISGRLDEEIIEDFNTTDSIIMIRNEDRFHALTDNNRELDTSLNAIRLTYLYIDGVHLNFSCRGEIKNKKLETLIATLMASGCTIYQDKTNETITFKQGGNSLTMKLL